MELLTYMAQEKLEQAAKEMGVDIKVETQGGVGAENVLTAKENVRQMALLLQLIDKLIWLGFMVND